MTAPLWALLLSGLGGPVLSAAVAGFAVYFTRKSAAQSNALDARSAAREEQRAQREETGRNLRAALSLAMSADGRQRTHGLQLLRALYASGILDQEQRSLAATTLATALEPLARDIAVPETEVSIRESDPTAPAPEEER